MQILRNPPHAVLLIGSKPILARPIRKAFSDIYHLYTRQSPRGSIERLIINSTLFPVAMGTLMLFSPFLESGFEKFIGGCVFGQLTYVPFAYLKNLTFSLNAKRLAQKLEVIKACERGDIQTLERLKNVIGNGRWRCSIFQIKKIEQKHGYRSLLYDYEPWRSVTPLQAVHACSHPQKKYETLNWFLKQNLLNHQEQEMLLYEFIQNAPIQSLQEHLRINPHPGQDFEVLQAFLHRNFSFFNATWKDQIEEVKAIASLLYPHFLTPKSLQEYHQKNKPQFGKQMNADVLHETFLNWMNPFLFKDYLEHQLPHNEKSSPNQSRQHRL